MKPRQTCLASTTTIFIRREPGVAAGMLAMTTPMQDPPANTAHAVLEIMRATRAIHRLKPDAVPPGLLMQVLEAAVGAPSRHNCQPWRFVVLQHPEARRFFCDCYLGAMQSRHPRASRARRRTPLQRGAWYLAEHLHEVPIILLVCGEREWPHSTPPTRRFGKAPLAYESLFPCIQNILLACRAVGLGASLTMQHEYFEDALCHYLDIPDEFGIAAAIPIGFPAEPFGTVRRRPAADVTFFDRWNRHG